MAARYHTFFITTNHYSLILNRVISSRLSKSVIDSLLTIKGSHIVAVLRVLVILKDFCSVFDSGFRKYTLNIHQQVI